MQSLNRDVDDAEALYAYIPQGIGGVMDILGSMMLSAPTLKDKTGYFPDRNMDMTFFALNEGLKAVRKKVGEKNYQMRVHFEADPEDNTEDGVKGRDCIWRWRLF